MLSCFLRFRHEAAALLQQQSHQHLPQRGQWTLLPRCLEQCCVRHCTSWSHLVLEVALHRKHILCRFSGTPGTERKVPARASHRSAAASTLCVMSRASTAGWLCCTRSILGVQVAWVCSSYELPITLCVCVCVDVWLCLVTPCCSPAAPAAACALLHGWSEAMSDELSICSN